MTNGPSGEGIPGEGWIPGRRGIPGGGPVPGWGPIPKGHKGVYVPDLNETLEQVRRAGESMTENWVRLVREALTEGNAAEKQREVE
jgi:hypothetical protein